MKILRMNEALGPTRKTKVRRLPDRGKYDREVINSILNEALICHVGFTVEGQPYVIPTGFARIHDALYIHGSAASRMLRNLAKGIDVCVTITLLDGLVLARSAFHHSINYRSVMLFGQAQKVEDPAAKLRALENFVEHMYPGRWKELRPVNDQELKATMVLHMPIDEGAVFARDEGHDKARFHGQRDAHDVGETEPLPFLAVGPPPDGAVGQHPVDVQRDRLQVLHCGATSTRRNFLMIGCSRSKTRLTPSPMDFSTSRMSLTMREIPFGSSDAA